MLWNIKCNLRTLPSLLFASFFFILGFLQKQEESKKCFVKSTHEKRIFLLTHLRFLHDGNILSLYAFWSFPFVFHVSLYPCVHRRKCFLFNRNKLEYFCQYLRILSFYDDFYEEVARNTMKGTWNFHDHLTVSKKRIDLTLWTLSWKVVGDVWLCDACKNINRYRVHHIEPYNAA